MNKHQLFNEIKAYEERQKYSAKDIYTTCLSSYTNNKTINKIEEYILPTQKYDKCGVIPEMSLVWYGYNYRLTLFRYEKREYDEISCFSGKILFFDILRPKEGIFNEKIEFCVVVITESEVIIYGVDKNTLCLINTNFVVSTSSKSTCYSIINGSIFLGCEDGNVYEVVYKGLDSWTFKMMYLFNPNSSLISCLVPSILRRRKPSIKSMSVNEKFLVTLSREVNVYNIVGGIYKVKTIPIYKEYVDIQILDTDTSDIFFYCVLPDGTREFYDNRHLNTKACFIEEKNSQIFNLRIKTSSDKFVMIQNDKYQGDIVYFVTFNKFHKHNIDRSKPSENLEIFAISEDVQNCFLKKNVFYAITRNKLILYEIMSLKKIVEKSRIEELQNIIKDIDLREILSLYYELLSLNCDASKLDFLVVKSGEMQLKGLFTWIYRQVKSFINLSIKDVLDDENIKNELEKTSRKFKNLCIKLSSNTLKIGLEFMKYFNQTVFFVQLLDEYSIDLKYKSFYELVVKNDAEFKKVMLNEIMEIFKINRTLDNLISILSNKAPDYLPLEDIYYHKGFDLLRKYPSKEKLWESLRNFKFIPFNENIIERYNELKFYTGSIILLRKYFLIDFEQEVEFLRSSIKCCGAIKQGLEDIRTEFQYAFLEALCQNLKESEIKSDCMCCDIKISIKFAEIIKLDSKYLPGFLKEKSEISSDPSEYELYWKYCAYRDLRTEAVDCLTYLIKNKTLTFEKKIDLLQKAKTVSMHTPYQKEITVRCNLMKIQKELINRGESGKFINNILLDACKLFNDYAYKYPDLSLKILDIVTFKDKFKLKEIWTKCLNKDFNAAVNFITKNKFSGNALDCEIIADLLIEKMNKGDMLSSTLFNLGFTTCEIQRYIEHKIKGSDESEFRNFLLEDFRLFTKDKVHLSKLEHFCTSNALN